MIFDQNPGLIVAWFQYVKRLETFSLRAFKIDIIDTEFISAAKENQKFEQNLILSSETFQVVGIFFHSEFIMQ